jgi:hypothetical protein
MKKQVEAESPSREFYAVDKVDGNFFIIETILVNDKDQVVKRERDESDYLAVKLAKLKHSLFGKYYF